MSCPGTSMPISTNAELFPVFVLGLGDSPKPSQSKSPLGTVKYTTGCLLKVRKADGTIGTDRTASISVINPVQGVYEEAQYYMAKGRVWVQPWLAQGGYKSNLSITCEELVPFSDKPKN